MPDLQKLPMWNTVQLFRRVTQQVLLVAGLVGSIALLPIAMVQGAATRRRVPILPPAKAPLSGRIAGVGKPIRLLAVGESSVCGVGVSRGDETVAAVAARALALLWQIYSRRCSLQIHFRQCGHRCGGGRAMSSRMA